MLRRRDAGESDRILTVFTLEAGKEEITARGARRSTSKTAGLTEPMSVGTFSLAQTKSKAILTQAQQVQPNLGLRQDFMRLQCGLALMEVVETSLPWHKPFPELFGLTLHALELLQAHPNPVLALLWSELKIMQSTGHECSFAVCTTTGKPLRENPAHLSPVAGGYISASLAQDYNDLILVDPEVAIGLDRLSKTMEVPQAMKHTEASWKALGWFWRSFLESPLPVRKALEDFIAV